MPTMVTVRCPACRDDASADCDVCDGAKTVEAELIVADDDGDRFDGIAQAERDRDDHWEPPERDSEADHGYSGEYMNRPTRWDR